MSIFCQVAAACQVAAGACIVVACIAADAHEVVVCPDKTIPIAYIGEPLHLEVISDQDRELSATLKATGSENSTRVLPPMRIWANEKRWLPVPNFAEQRGLYKLDLTVNGEILWTGNFCRIDRPTENSTLPVAVLAEHIGPGDLDVLAHLAIPNIYADSLAAEVLENTRRYFPNQTFTRPANPEQPLLRFGSTSHTTLSTGLFINDPEKFSTALKANITTVLIESPTDAANLTTYRDLAESAGVEGIEWIALQRGPLDQTFAWSLVEKITEGYRSITVETTSLHESGSPTQGFALVSGATGLLANSRYIGPLETDAPIHAEVFLDDNAKTWTIITKADETLNVDFEVASPLRAYDIYNNPLAEITGEIKIGPTPQFLKGTGADVLLRAARSRVLSEAEIALTAAQKSDPPPEGIAEIITSIGGTEDPVVNRYALFGLLRLLPSLEETSLRNPESLIIPIIATTMRLARALAVLDQQQGQPFLDPLHATLSRCRRFLDEFAASAETKSHRAHWLITEVERLVKEAHRLADVGRPIEAEAIAAIAEWRSRSLAPHAAPPQVEPLKVEPLKVEPPPHEDEDPTNNEDKKE